jgi:predicted phosphodiesterase
MFQRVSFYLCLSCIFWFPAQAAGWKDSVFSQQPEEKPLLSFGVVADVQYCDCEAQGTRYYRLSPAKLREAMAAFKQDSVQFIINLGDLIDREYSSFAPVLDILDSSGLETWHCLGNHDFSVDPELKDRIPVAGPGNKGYYSFTLEQFRFIFMDGNEISTYSGNNKSTIRKASKLIESLRKEGAMNAHQWNGAVSNRQLKWLRQQLDEALEKNERVIINCHFPVFPENAHNLLNYKEVLSLLENYDHVIAWFNGHNHAGNYRKFHDIHCITFRGMVETESGNSYAVVEVYRNRIIIKGYGWEEGREVFF